MSAIYEEVLRRLEAGGRVALATLRARRGSAPGSLGAKMAVGEGGSVSGSIGGGCVEAEVWDAAREAIAGGDARVLAFRLNERDMAESGLICGGNVEILVEPLADAHLELIREVVAVRQARGQALLVTSVPADGGAPAPPESSGGSPGRRPFKVLLMGDGRVVGPGADIAPVEALRAEWDRLPHALTRVIDRGAVEEGATEGDRLLLESLAPPASLVVFGGGHLSEQLVPLAKKVHFHVTVVDDRPVFANVDRFPDADRVLVSEFDEAFDQVEIGSDTFVVIVTRGHLHDRLCLERSVATDAAYVGMVGSRAKIKKTYDALEAVGVPRERLERVHSPIGLFIHARLPEEIAVSIVAELIEVRNARLFG